jgi:hypothetical protein
MGTTEQLKEQFTPEESWRWGCLVEVGYSPELASRLAMSSRVDLHKAIDLVKDGCPPELASEILL